jgi:predicted nucleic acid-binding protein
VTVFVDTAVIMYAGGADHPLREPSQILLGRVADGRLDATSSVEVVQEILHRFTALGRAAVGAAMARHTLDLFAPLLPLTEAVMRRVPELVERYDLSARDLVHVASCIDAGIGLIVSPDRGFDRVGELRRVDISDEQGWSALVR